MELQVSRSICAEVPAESILWGQATGSGRDIKRTVQMEGSNDNNGGGVSGPYTYAIRNTAKDKCIGIYGVPKR